MHVTACLAGQEDVAVEVGESCRTLQALREVQRGHNRSFQPRL